MTTKRIIHLAIGAWLAIFTTAVVSCNQTQVGVARDETVYMTHGAKYADWWTGLVTFDHGVSAQSIGGTFGCPPPPPNAPAKACEATANNREHPPLMKTLMGFSQRLLDGKLGITDELSAFRFPSAVMHGICAALVYAMALELFGLAEGILASLLLLLLPRALFHAGLACFDAPAMTLWFATIFAYWRCLDGRKWPWQCGVVWGLALATKHTALLLPFAIGLHFIILAIRRGFDEFFVTHWRVIVSFVYLGPLTLFLLWPWLWLAPYDHVSDWLRFHLDHVHYNYEYLGKNWNHPRFPWHVALVTTLFTVPVATLAASVLGAGRWIAQFRAKQTPQPDRAPVLLLALSLVASMGPFALGSTPIFGAEKHWMPALPTICIAAAVGACWAARSLASLFKVPNAAAIAVIGGALVVAAASETISAEPYALTWYDTAAGGAPGGADLGMNRQFWGVSAKGVLPFLAARAPAKVYTHDASPAWGLYQRLGEIPKTLVDSGNEVGGVERSDYAIVIHELHFNRHDYLIWKSYGTTKPVFVLRSDGVPIVSVYQRPPKR